MGIEIIRKKDMFCYETAFSTICNYFNVPYQMLFSHTWCYDYNGADLCIGNNIIINDWELFDKMRKLGIEEMIDKVDAKDVTYIRSMLEQEQIAIIRMDMMKFNEINGTSYMGMYSPYLLYDYDDEFIAYDLHYTHENIKISEELFQNACSNICFYGVENKNVSFAFEYDLEDLQKILIPHKPNFEKIEQLARLFADGAVDLKYETKDLSERDNPVYALLINKIETLARGRNLFSMYLDYINSMISEIDIEEESEKMAYWAGKWNLVKVILIKAFLKKDFEQDVMKKVALIIFEIAKGEKELYEQLLSVRTNNKEIDNKYLKLNNKLTQYEVNVVRIDLTNKYNNAGIKIAGTDKKADMLFGKVSVRVHFEQICQMSHMHGSNLFWRRCFF